MVLYLMSHLTHPVYRILEAFVISLFIVHWVPKEPSRAPSFSLPPFPRDSTSWYRPRVTLVLSRCPFWLFLVAYLHPFVTPIDSQKHSLPRTPKPPYLDRNQSRQQQLKNGTSIQQRLDQRSSPRNTSDIIAPDA